MKIDCLGTFVKVPSELTRSVQNVDMLSLQWKAKMGLKTTHPGRGVIYIGHLPHGFYEEALYKYFNQFGDITRLSVGRSVKTGRPRGFAFLEFYHKEVAQIVASTMNNYLMFDKLLKCEFVPHNKVKPNMFINSEATRLSWPKKRQRESALLQHNMDRSAIELCRSNKRRRRRIVSIKKRLQHLGVDYDIENFLDSPEKNKKEEMTKNEAEEKKEEAAECTAKEEVAAGSTNSSPQKVHVLEIHDSEEEIDFRTPPGTMKRRLLSTSKIDNFEESVIKTKKKKARK